MKREREREREKKKDRNEEGGAGFLYRDLVGAHAHISQPFKLYTRISHYVNIKKYIKHGHFSVPP